MSESNTPPPSATTGEGDPKDQKLSEDRKLRQQLQVEDLRFVMSTPAGRRFVHRVLGLCGTFRLSFTGEQTHTTAFNEGKRSLGNQLFAEVEAVSPEAFVDMLREAQRTKKPRGLSL